MRFLKHNLFNILVLFVLSLLVSTKTFSQRESANWYFGNLAGLTFNSGNPVPLNDGQLVTKEGCATISDTNGNLLFYTDGTTVWDRQHNIMPNGINLLGHSSSTMSALIIPKPGNSQSYFIFTIDKPSYFLTEDQPIDGVNYSEVNMSLNNGFGDVVVTNKNKHLITYDASDPVQNEYKSSEKITAVTHSDGSTIWVITQFINKFYAFRVDFDGVNETPIISTVQQTVLPRFDEEGSNITAIGYLKVSPDGKKIAIAHSSISLGSPASGTKKSGKVLLYDFNNSTGIVSNERTIINDTYPYGVEFSPNSKVLYLTASTFDTSDVFINSNLFQYNLESSDIVGSRQSISNSDNVAGALQLAIDGKIYRAGYKVFSTGFNLSVISNPNNLGNSSNYSHNSVPLGDGYAQLGLPPFVQSIFKFTFDYENTCLGDATHFYITSEDPYDTVLWDFGDGQTSTLEEPYHTYSQSGTFTVKLWFTINGITQDPLIKQIKISEPPAVLPNTYDLIQCDSFDSNPNDGITTYNLALANGPLTYNTTNPIQVFYYHSIANANSDTTNANALNTIYTSQYQDELLYAKVFTANTDCYSMASIRLKTSQSVDLDVFEFEACDSQNNGIATFNLDNKRSEIINALNLPANVSITFYTSPNNAAIGTNPLQDLYTSTSRTLYIRAESNNVCYGNGLLNLIVKPFPTLQDQTVIVCQADFPVYINTGLSNTDVSNYNYLWSTNQTSSEIYVTQPGVYNVTISDPILNCEDSITITVIQNEIAEIASIEVNDYDATIHINNSVADFVFALDDINGVYQPSNMFFGLTPGIHTVFVRDIYNCNTISEQFYVIGFPKYFTPNDDGNNDVWNIKGLDPTEFQNVVIHVYNRYGKLLKVFNPNQSSGWNGKFNGELLTPDDYWFYLKLPDGKEYRGHFSLKI